MLRDRDRVSGTTVEVLAVLFLATFIRSALGFGEALVAVPLLALVMPVQVVAPLAVLVSISVAAVVVIQDWRNVHVRSAGWLVLSTLFGIPLGLLLLKTVPESIVKAILGVFIVAFALYSLAGRKPQLHSDRLAPFFGFIAGILGGAYGMNGPPLVVYGVLRRWTPAQFRATLQGYFLIASMVGMAGYALTGLWTRTVSRYFLLSLPLALIAIFLGTVLHRRLSSARFLVCVNVGLALIGLLLLRQALHA
ncbi:MAG: sulfite exporter TauE/SafE family protein [Bryobacteraceae bacterium]